MELSNYFKITNKLPENVNLLAVSKGFDAISIKSLYEVGQINFGESKLQEFMKKQTSLKDFLKLKWHFIGRLQTNKITKIIKQFDYIHSVDSFEKLAKISNSASAINKSPSIMIQVKLADDPNKAGMTPDELLTKWIDIKNLKSINVTGLMTINPKGLSTQENFMLFKKCRYLVDSLQLEDCSMGMSNDWEQAIDAGANWIRIGSLIFGNRNI